MMYTATWISGVWYVQVHVYSHNLLEYTFTLSKNISKLEARTVSHFFEEGFLLVLVIHFKFPFYFRFCRTNINENFIL